MTNNQEKSFLVLDSIHKYYNNKNQTVHALKGLSLTFDKQGFVIIYGKSGCGKTSLMNIMAGSINYDKGTYLYNAINANAFTNKDWDNHRKNHISFVFQDFRLIDELTVYDNIALPLRLSTHNEVFILEKVKEALHTVDLDMYEKRYPSELSGGEKQRVAIARAIVKENTVIIADEPTGNLDSKTSKVILELLKKIAHTRLVIMVTHDEENASNYADRRIQMQDGKVIDDECLTPRKTVPYEISEPLSQTNPNFFKYGAKIAFANFKTKKLRFFVNYILVVITFLLAAYAMVGLTFQKEPIIEDFIKDEHVNFVSLYQSLCPPSDIGQSNCSRHSEGSLLYHALAKNDLNVFFERIDAPVKLNDIEKNAIMYQVIESDQYQNFALLNGDYPEEVNDILMTDFLAKELFRMSDVKALVGTVINVFNEDYTITGIIKTDYALNPDIDAIRDERLSFAEYHFFLKNYGYVVTHRNVEPNDSLRLGFANIFYDEAIAFDSLNHINIGKYVDDSVNILYGRGIENANEVVVSSRYFAAFKLEEHFDNIENQVYTEEEIAAILNKEFSFLDIYNASYGTAYYRYINLHEYFPDVEIVGVYQSYGLNDILTKDTVFDDIAFEYAMYYGFSNYALKINVDDIQDTLKYFNEESIQIDHMHLPVVYQFEEARDNISEVVILITTAILLILILFIYLYISMSIDLRRKQIETLRLLGCTKKQVNQVFNFEHMLGTGVMLLSGTLFYAVSLVVINRNFRSSTNQFDVLYPFNIVRFDFKIIVFLVFLMVVSTIFSSYITARKYAKISSGEI